MVLEGWALGVAAKKSLADTFKLILQSGRTFSPRSCPVFTGNGRECLQSCVLCPQDFPPHLVHECWEPNLSETQSHVK